MANYESPLLNATVTTAFRSAGVLYVNTVTATQRRIQVYEVEFGQAGGLASTDVQVQWDLSRFGATAGLVGTSVVPNSMDSADVSPLSIFQNNLTTDPTYTTAGFGLSLKSWGINQRGSYRWRALDDGDNIIIPATAQLGIGLRQQTITGANANQSAIGNLSFIER